MTKLMVIGSLNMDLEVDVPHFPKAGETLVGSAMTSSYGGKGANQAVAAARLGAITTMVGAIGKDAYGLAMKNNLKENNVDTGFIIQKPMTPSGVAFITRSPDNNTIILSSGANAAFHPEDLERIELTLKKVDILLLQLEIPLPTLCKAIEMGKKYGKTIVLNPAPAQNLPEELIMQIDYILPNEHEIFSFTQNEDHKIEEIILRSKAEIIMTYGAKGVLFRKEGKIVHWPAHQVPAVDTTGAGDTFCGAFCAFLPHYGVEKSILYAQKAAALSITQKGAQGGMPYLQDLGLLA